MACVRSLTLPEARLAVCAATSLRKLNSSPILPYVSITSGMNSPAPPHHSFVLVVLIGLADLDGSPWGTVFPWRGWLACVVSCVAHDVGDGDVCEDCDAGVSQAVDSDVWAQVVGVAVRFVVPGISPLGSVNVVKPPFADRLDGELYLVVRLCWLHLRCGRDQVMKR